MHVTRRQVKKWMREDMVAALEHGAHLMTLQQMNRAVEVEPAAALRCASHLLTPPQLGRAIRAEPGFALLRMAAGKLTLTAEQVALCTDLCARRRP